MTGPSDPVYQYLAGQMRPGHPALIEAFLREGEAAIAARAPRLDLPYGPHERERFDLFAAPGAAATLLYLHAGYWQGRDKAQFRFLAPPFVDAGFNVALANYPLCPDASLAALTASVRRAVPAVLRAAGGTGGLVAIGHSAGAHLAAELALTDWDGPSPVTAIIGLSGVYDLDPLRATPLNDRLGLDAEAARAASPVHRVKPRMPPAIFAVGGDETPAFRAQTGAMHAAWRAAGNIAHEIVVPGADHFSLLRHLADPASPLFAAIAPLAAPRA